MESSKRTTVILAVLTITVVAYTAWMFSDNSPWAEGHWLNDPLSLTRPPRIRYPRLPPLPPGRRPSPVPLPEERFARATPISMAALLLDPEEKGFAAARPAEAMGIPLFVTRDVTAALRQPMVLLAGQLGARWLPPSVTARLRRYVRAGGTLIIDDPEARVVMDLADVIRALPSVTRFTMRFEMATNDPGFRHLLAPEAQTIRLGSPRLGMAVITQAMTPRPGSESQVLATFDDRMPALIRRDLGRGRVYLLGVRLQDLILRPQGNRDHEAQRWQDNHLEPSADVPQILLRDWYLHYVPGAVTLDPIPRGLTGALILTHDVDSEDALSNIRAYVNAERARDVRATYFVQTKYVQDYQDAAFFDRAAQAVVALACRRGSDIASRAVALAYDWRSYPEGDETETAATYGPQVLGRGLTHREGLTVGGTVAGEVRASKQLLQMAAPRPPVVAFRSGYLQANPRQWQVLEANGYRFDSSYPANDVMTVFPYTAMRESAFSEESRITEFPVLIADSVRPLAGQIERFRRLLDQIAVFHGVCVLLIHTDVVGEKLATETALIDHVRGRFWIGCLRQFGRFWEARKRVRLTATRQGDRETIILSASAAIDGLTLNLSRGWAVEQVDGSTWRASPAGRTVILPHLKPGRPIVLHLQPRPSNDDGSVADASSSSPHSGRQTLHGSRPAATAAAALE